MDSVIEKSLLKDQQGPSNCKIDKEILQQRLQYYKYESESSPITAH